MRHLLLVLIGVVSGIAGGFYALAIGGYFNTETPPQYEASIDAIRADLGDTLADLDGGLTNLDDALTDLDDILADLDNTLTDLDEAH